MRRQFPLVGTILAVSMIWASGCRPQQPHYLFEDGDLSHYLGEATSIEYPDARVASLEEVEMDGQNRPLTLLSLQHPDEADVWNLSLEQAVQIALANNKVMRKLTRAVGSLQDYLTSMPQGVSSTYDPALAETSPLSGPEAALSAFDAQLRTSLFWELNDYPRNIDPALVGGGGPAMGAAGVATFFPPTFQQDLGTFMAEISKTNVTGGRTTIRHNVIYDLNNTGSRQWPSDWTVNVEAEFRQPLLQGAGVQFNRIAGPGATPGINNGVVLARINTDIRLADFEAEVRNMVNDVERAYWGLYLAYRRLDTAKEARNSTLRLWRHVYDLYQEGAEGGDAASESQVREQYFFYQSAAEAALSSLYSAENNLRYMMGISATDGRLIRPSDEPTTARIEFPWPQVHDEAIARSVDLRRQRWTVKQREMELIAAKNYLLPRLDAVGRYRWRGLGDDLIHSEGSPTDPFDTAYQNMMSGRFQEWQLGVELSLPIGFRREMAGVRHAQLALARERSLLQEQELEVSHQMAQAIRELEGSHKLAETGLSRLEAANHNVKVLKEKRGAGARLSTGPLEIKVLLDAQRNLADAEGRFYEALTNYALSIAQVHFHKGSLLEYNGVYLAEGPWPAKAYFDATRHARERDAALYMDYGRTRPRVISRGPYEQHAGTSGGEPAQPAEGTTTQSTIRPEPELIPTPDAMPLEAPLPPDNRSASASGSAGYRRATGGSPRAPAPAVISRNAGAAADRKPHELGDGLGALAGKSAGGSATATDSRDGVRPVSYQQPASPAVRGGWTAKRPSARTASVRHEPVENPPPDQADRPSSGWKKSQL